MRFPQIETLIWDFNGTIVDDLDLAVRSVNAQLTERRLPTLTLDRYRDVFEFPVERYYRKIGFDLDHESMADVSADFFRTYAPGLATCPLHDGVRPVLEGHRASGLRQFVLSAMEEELLVRTVDRLGIAEFFDAIYGLDHLQADSKLSRGRDLLADFAIRPETALLIGDTDHDAQVAVGLGTSVVLVATGHQNAARLRRPGVLVLPSAAEILSLVAPTEGKSDGSDLP